MGYPLDPPELHSLKLGISTVCCGKRHTVKGFSIVNEAEVGGFLEFSCFFYDQNDAGNLVSGSSASLKPRLYI